MFLRFSDNCFSFKTECKCLFCYNFSNTPEKKQILHYQFMLFFIVGTQIRSAQFWSGVRSSRVLWRTSSLSELNVSTVFACVESTQTVSEKVIFCSSIHWTLSLKIIQNIYFTGFSCNVVFCSLSFDYEEHLKLFVHIVITGWSDVM